MPRVQFTVRHLMIFIAMLAITLALEVFLWEESVAVNLTYSNGMLDFWSQCVKLHFPQLCYGR